MHLGHFLPVPHDLRRLSRCHNLEVTKSVEAGIFIVASEFTCEHLVALRLDGVCGEMNTGGVTPSWFKL